MRLLGTLVVLWCLYGANGAQAEEAYILGQEAVVSGEAFCKTLDQVNRVAKAYARSRVEGEEVERNECYIPTKIIGVDLRTGRYVAKYREVVVWFVSVERVVKVPDSGKTVTVIKVTNGDGAVSFMTTYSPVEDGEAV